MYKIYFDTTDRYKKILTLENLEDGKVYTCEGDFDIVEKIKELLTEHKIEIQEIQNVDFNKGPGSFTGLKVSASITNALNWALGKKNISNLDYPDYGREPNITLKG